MKKNILIIFFIILLISAFFFLWKTTVQIDSDISAINGLLYQLDIEMDILEHSKKNYIDDQYLEEKLTHLIANNLLILSHVNPPINKLRGTPLYALNRVIAFNKSNPINFKLGESEYVSQSIENYLNQIEDQVKIEINKRDKRLQDPLKREFKENWGIIKETD